MAATIKHIHSAHLMTWESARDVLDEKRKPQNRMCVCVWYVGKHCSKKKKVLIHIENVLENFLKA